MIPAMPNLRKIVLAELKRREWTTYQLAQELKGKRPKGKDVPQATVYAFMRGVSPINSDDLGLILEALDIRVKAGGK